MKKIEHMNMSERDNFNQAVVGYINNNLPFIKELSTTNSAEDLAKASLLHYNETVEASGQEDEQLSDEQKEHFLATAERLFKQGYVEHGGTLND